MRIKKGWSDCEHTHTHTHSHTQTKHEGKHIHLIFTAEGEVTSGVKAAVTQHCRVISVENMELWCKRYCCWGELIPNSRLSSLSLPLCPSQLPSLPLPPSLPPSLPPALSSPYLSLFFSARSPAISPHQPLPFTAAGVREGEGEPGGADGALLQGAAGTSCLWQHQECHHTRANVRQPRSLFYLQDLSSRSDLFPRAGFSFSFDALSKPGGGRHPGTRLQYF